MDEVCWPQGVDAEATEGSFPACGVVSELLRREVSERTENSFRAGAVVSELGWEVSELVWEASEAAERSFRSEP